MPARSAYGWTATASPPCSWPRAAVAARSSTWSASGSSWPTACARPLGKLLGREWHRETVYGVAGRSYADSTMSDDPWISSHLELRDEEGQVLSGYGWIFPLGNGEVNVGVGTLATAKRPADVAIKPLMSYYAEQRRADFGLGEELRMPTSALLPMGGAVSGVAGANWALIGDAAACVNPLNGEGIDYGLESGRMVVETMASHRDLSQVWPALLREHYGEAFSIARRLAGLVTVPRLLPTLGPAGMRSDWLMTLALRWMGNLVTDEDRDRAARVWRWAGRRSIARDAPTAVRLRPRVERWYRATGVATRLVVRALDVRLHYAGLEHVPTSGPVVIASTHVSYPDFIWIGLAAHERGRWVRFLTRHDVWNGRARRPMTGMRHIPVDREAPPRRTSPRGACCVRARRSACSRRPGSPTRTPSAR